MRKGRPPDHPIREWLNEITVGAQRFAKLTYQLLAFAVGLTCVVATGASTQGIAPVLSGCEPDYPPYCIVTADNRADGFSVELLRAALKAMGREVVFKTGPWDEIKQALADGRLQALPLVGRTPEREASFDFTFPYLTMHGAIVVREGSTNILAAADLNAKQVAVLQGDNAEEYLRRANLGAIIVPRPSFETALRELSGGEHDAVVIQKLLALQLMQRAGLTNLVTAGPPLKDFTQNFCFAARKGDAELLAALNEGLAIVMADGTYRALHAKWFSALEALGRTKSRIVVGGDSDYPPYEFLDQNGQPAGFDVAMTRAIARQMGLPVEIRLGPWSSIRKGLGSGDIDMVQGMFYSADRDKEFTFSPPYAVVHHAIVVRAGTPVPADMKSLAGKAILVMAGDIMEDVAKAQGYGSQLVAVSSQEEALRLLAAGRHDCALVAKVPALYWIAKNGWRNLRVSEHPVFSAEYCYAVPQGNDELLAHFDEGLAALKASGEYRRIQTEWLGPYEGSGMSFRTVAPYVLAPSLLLLGLLAGSLLWSRSLKRQVAARTQTLQQEIAVRRGAETRLAAALEERERSEAELAQSEAFLNALLEAMPTPVFYKDCEGRYMGCNPAFEQFLGRSRSDIIGKSVYDMAPKEIAEAYHEKDRELFAKPGTQTYDWCVMTRAGDRRDVIFHKATFKDAQGRVAGLIGAILDITERKRTEAALRTNEQRHRALLGAIPDLIFRMDRNGIFRDWKPAARVGLYVQPSDFIGKNQRDVLPSEVTDVTAPAIARALETGVTQTCEYNLPVDGVKRYFEVRIVKVDDVEVVAVVRDITEGKRSEAKRRELEKNVQEQQKLAAVGTLACGMGHEINNPIMGIINYAQLIKDRLQGKDEALEEFAGEIGIEAERVAGVIRGLSAFSTRDMAPRVSTAVSDLVESAVTATRDTLTQDEITIEVDLPDSLPKIACDRAQMGQVVTSLIDNARDALNERYPEHDGNKTIIISAKALAESGQSTSSPSDIRYPKSEIDYVRISVEDHGAGIPPEVREHIFEPFYTTKDRSVGAGNIGKGLGLFVSYATVQEHGGVLNVESEPGQWTRFHVELPISDI